MHGTPPKLQPRTQDQAGSLGASNRAQTLRKQGLSGTRTTDGPGHSGHPPVQSMVCNPSSLPSPEAPSYSQTGLQTKI